MKTRFDGHTPGPWELLHPRDDREIIITCHPQLSVYQDLPCTVCGANHVNGVDFWHIAKTSRFVYRNHGCTSDSVHRGIRAMNANALLMAASPDLLKRCVALYEMLKMIKEKDVGLVRCTQRPFILYMIEELAATEALLGLEVKP